MAAPPPRAKRTLYPTEMSSSRRITRKVVVCSVIFIFITLSLIFLLELSFVEKLENRQGQPRGLADDVVKSEETRTPCPKVSEDHTQVRVTRPGSMDMTEVYHLLKRRKKYELRVEKSTRELWWYLRNQLRKVEVNQHTNSYLDSTMMSVRNQYLSLQWRYEELQDVSLDSGPFQLNWKYWQRNISLELASTMRKRIDYLQNPPNCKLVKKLVCRVAKSCGFGCQIHHVSFCFIMAYSTKRTLILDSTNWRYSPKGWNAIFQPISSACTEIPSGMCIINNTPL